jgi:hypothetical protein
MDRFVQYHLVTVTNNHDHDSLLECGAVQSRSNRPTFQRRVATAYIIKAIAQLLKILPPFMDPEG